MIFKSIKWRLQIWYGLILVVVLAGFGFTAYLLEWGRQVRRIEFQLPPQAAGVFDSNTPNNPNNFYFIIQLRDGREIARSTNVPDRVSEDKRFSLWHTKQAPTPGAAAGIVYGNLWEKFQLLPSGEAILLGCSFASELKELHRTALKLAGVGGIILFFGLAGGWWIVSRSLRPVIEISAAAVKISAGDLSQRINIAEAESELGQLAAVLNSTFARLEAAFAQQQQFTSDAAHELRTPVSVMLTQTQTALTRERSAPEYRETVEACQRAAQ